MIICLTTLTEKFAQDHLQSLWEDSWEYIFSLLGLRGPLRITWMPVFRLVPKIQTRLPPQLYKSSQGCVRPLYMTYCRNEDNVFHYTVMTNTQTKTQEVLKRMFTGWNAPWQITQTFHLKTNTKCLKPLFICYIFTNFDQSTGQLLAGEPDETTLKFLLQGDFLVPRGPLGTPSFVRPAARKI